MPSLDQVLDPRGRRTVPRVSRAARRGTLRDGPVIVVDNGKLRGRSSYEPILPTLVRQLTDDYDAGECAIIRTDVLASAPSWLESLADRIFGMSPSGVVALLGDAGSVRDTVLVNVMLEKLGVPTVTLVTEGAARVARTIAGAYADALAIVVLDISHLDEPDDVAAKIRDAAPEIYRELTTDGGAREDENSDTLIPSASDDRHLDVDAAEPDELLRTLQDLHATDGLPVVPPTMGRVKDMLAAGYREGSEILLAEAGPLGVELTVEKVAIGAVMAGCAPEHFPIVLAAAEAASAPTFNWSDASVTAHPAGMAIAVSGPYARRAGMNAAGGSLGPGCRANAAIGRAISLVNLAVLRAIPGISDMSTIGSPAEYAYCFAENLEASPWPAAHAAEYGDDVTMVTVVKSEGPSNVVDEYARSATSLLRSLVSSLTTVGNNNVYRPGECLIILNPLHARLLSGEGWSRDDVQRYVHNYAVVPDAETNYRGTIPRRPQWMSSLENIPITRYPEDVLIFVTGGEGSHSMVAHSWGFSESMTAAVTKPGEAATAAVTP
jgi:hypothetical protein